jgi:hypothetical protein
MRLCDEWARYWDLSCPVLLEKSPPNLVHTRFLQHMFPEARFVVILRHPIAVSMTTAKRGGIPLYTLIEHWLVCQEQFCADLAYLRHVHVLWYEDLVNRPQETLDGVCAFLGLDSVPLAEPIRSHNARYIAKWNRLGRSDWGSIYQGAICRRFEARVSVFGYSLVDPEFFSPNVPSPRMDDLARPSLLSRIWCAGGTAWESVNRGPLQALRGWLRSS